MDEQSTGTPRLITDVAELQTLLTSGASLKGVRIRGIDFSGHVFESDVNFSHLTFAGNVSFARASFSGNAMFGATVFEGRADFSSTEWAGDAKFPAARFGGPAIFRRARFRKEAKFGRARFGATADFEIARFDGETYFGYAEFKDVTFYSARFLERVFFDAGPVQRIFSPQHEARFVSVFFEKPEDAIFRSANRQMARFANTDLSRVTFSDVEWPTRPGRGNRRKALFDELAFRHDDNWRWIEKAYRDLRRNYEDKGNYADAGDFYYGEMEVRRSAQPGVRRYISLVNLYKFLSG